MKLAVTGSSGQIGSYVSEVAISQGHGVIGIDIVPGDATTDRVDIRDIDQLRRRLRGCDTIVHCAAQVSVQRSLESPPDDASHNIIGSLNVLECARRLDVSRLVNISSAAVYGHPLRVPVSEEHPTVPLAPYGLSKLVVENYVRMYAESFGLTTFTVRPFNVYSPRQDPANPYTGVLSKFAQNVRSGRPPVIFGDGLQTRDFIHAFDVAEWLVALGTGSTNIPSGTTMNLGTGRGTTVKALAEMFIRAAGIDLVPVYRDPLLGEIRESVADIRRVSEHGFSATRDLQTGIAELVSAKTGPTAD